MILERTTRNSDTINEIFPLPHTLLKVWQRTMGYKENAKVSHMIWKMYSQSKEMVI